MSSYSATGVKLKDPSKGKQKKLINKVGDYLKSDSYLYATVVAPQPFSSRPTGEFRYIERVTKEVSMKTLATQDDQPTVRSPEEKSSKRYYSETSTSGQQAFGHKETVKHMVYQNFALSVCQSVAFVGGHDMSLSGYKGRWYIHIKMMFHMIRLNRRLACALG